MNTFTFIPVWVFQDVVVYAIGFAVLVFILRKEEHPEAILAELIAFCFCYAAVYENFATLIDLYGYGRSILMVFNVPLSVPLVEYLVVYTTLRLLDRRAMPAWAKPFVVGLSGMLFDFSLDPLAMKQVFDTAEGRIGRWTWYPGANDVQIYAEPVYNFTGWILLCGLFTATVLLGRAWHKKSGYKFGVGIAYPFLASAVALLLLVSPFSRFYLWLGPLMEKGSVAEWIMLAVNGGVGVVFLLVFGKRKPTVAKPLLEWPALLVLAGLPFLNLVLCLAGGFFDVFWLVAAAAVILSGLATVGVGIYRQGMSS